MRKDSKLILIFTFILIFLFNIGIVKADSKKLEITDISLIEKSETILVEEPVLVDSKVSTNITFNEKDDYVTFDLLLKNNDSKKYKINKISDNNTNDKLSIEYEYDENYIESGNTSSIKMKMKYKSKYINIDTITINDLLVNVSLVDEKGNPRDQAVSPATSDNVLHYLVLLIIAITGLIFLFLFKKRRKIGALLLLLAIVLTPLNIFASEKYEAEVLFTNIVFKGEFETYNIKIDKNDGSNPIYVEKTYGDKLGDLPENPTKDGYTFDKWTDDNGNEVDSETVINGPIEISAKYNLVEYSISYDYVGGSATNPSTYTIESDDITLNNPTKDGYTFAGWTGSNGNNNQTSVTIYKGSTGDKSFVAHYSTNPDTSYQVIHRYQNYDLNTYTEVVQDLNGPTDEEVTPAIVPKHGFKNPELQTITIAGTGDSKTVYVYERDSYSFNITDRTYIDNTSTSNGTYLYETPITIKAVERDGYDFRWSDGNTDYERTFDLTDNTTLTPIYTAKTNTPYKVIHKYQKLTLDEYDDYEQPLEGTTDEEVTPSLRPQTGFKNPVLQTVRISGSGDTVVTYYYEREKYRLTIEDAENIVEGDISDDYYYEDTVMLTAKDIDNKTFAGWSNGDTSNPILLTITGDLTIKPLYSMNGITVSFNTNGGSNVDSQIIEYGGKATRPTTNPTKTNSTFDDWYTTDSYTVKFDFENTTITTDTIVYAKFNEDPFPTVFSHENECTFNGADGFITGDNCEYADGVQKYIDTHIDLYNDDNHDKDYEIGFTIVSYNSADNVRQATFMNTKLEGNSYPGLVFRKKDSEKKLDFSSRTTSSANTRILFENPSEVQKVKIYRIYNEELDVQEIFYSLNDGDKIKTNDLSKFNPVFDLSVWFGAAPVDETAQTYQRVLKGTLSNMYIKLGKYQEEESEKYTITYNANGGSVTPTQKIINIGDFVGTNPTPTAPTGKTFIGWYTGLTDGVEVNSSYIPNNNITIYARYINDISNATVSPSSISMLKGDNQTITVLNTEEEYIFSSNDTNIASVDSTGKVTGNEVGTTTITITGSISGKTKTVNVTVKSNTYTVTLNPNGGTVTPTSITQNKGTGVGELPIPKAPTGEKFDGWYTGLTDGVEVTSSYTPNEDVTIYAKYVDLCGTFATDSWSTIKTNLESNFDYYGVGCEKEVELDMNNDSIPESYTVRLANTSTPEVCEKDGFSQTACGAVIEFVDEIYVSPLTTTGSSYNKGGWKSTNIVSDINNNIYNKLPTDLQNVIIPTYPIVSGSGSSGLSEDITIEDTNKNKLYLLSGREAGFNFSHDNKNNILTDTRTLDYYTNNSGSSYRIKKNLSGTAVNWWLRSASDYTTFRYFYVNTYGNGDEESSGRGYSIIPSFRIAKNTYTVMYNANGGRLTYQNKEVVKGSTIGTLPIPEAPDGKEFVNWYTQLYGGTVVDSSYQVNDNITIYARYNIPDHCDEFINDSWATIRDNIENDPGYYAVGCEKEVEIDMDDDGTNESYTVRIANTSTPEVCSTEGYSQTSCGFVIEFADILQKRGINSTSNAIGGWRETEMVVYLNSDFFNKLPTDLQNVIIPTYPIVSSSGKKTYVYEDSKNITNEDVTINKVFLLSGREVGFDSVFDNKKNILTDTRKLDYYYDGESTDANKKRIKKDLNGTAQFWWLRSNRSSGDITYDSSFIAVNSSGSSYTYTVNISYGVSPAFRIG